MDRFSRCHRVSVSRKMLCTTNATQQLIFNLFIFNLFKNIHYSIQKLGKLRCFSDYTDTIIRQMRRKMTRRQGCSDGMQNVECLEMIVIQKHRDDDGMQNETQMEYMYMHCTIGRTLNFCIHEIECLIPCWSCFCMCQDSRKSLG